MKDILILNKLNEPSRSDSDIIPSEKLSILKLKSVKSLDQTAKK
jgi:hypothetical protein